MIERSINFIGKHELYNKQEFEFIIHKEKQLLFTANPLMRSLGYSSYAVAVKRYFPDALLIKEKKSIHYKNSYKFKLQGGQAKVVSFKLILQLFDKPVLQVEKALMCYSIVEGIENMLYNSGEFLSIYRNNEHMLSVIRTEMQLFEKKLNKLVKKMDKKNRKAIKKGRDNLFNIDTDDVPTQEEIMKKMGLI